ncbi:MAG: hypothetical protein U0787_08790 [Polyangia bacterium]
MNDRIAQRLASLVAEYEAGQRVLVELEAKQKQVQQTGAPHRGSHSGAGELAVSNPRNGSWITPCCCAHSLFEPRAQDKGYCRYRAAYFLARSQVELARATAAQALLDVADSAQLCSFSAPTLGVQANRPAF